MAPLLLFMHVESALPVLSLSRPLLFHECRLAVWLCRLLLLQRRRIYCKQYSTYLKLLFFNTMFKLNYA